MFVTLNYTVSKLPGMAAVCLLADDNVTEEQAIYKQSALPIYVTVTH